MNEAIPAAARKSSGSYFERIRERIPEEASFYAGVFLTLGIPQIACVAYGATIPFVALAAAALGGTAWGVFMYRQTPGTSVSCVGTRGGLPKSPARAPIPLKKAA